MRKAKKRTIYSNYDIDFEASKESAFECWGECFGWESIEDVPDDKVYLYAEEESNEDWESESLSMEEFFGNGTFLLMGTVGRWDGPSEGGFVFGGFHELRKAWQDCDYIEIYDENGHFYIKCSHHDGTNFFEVKELTPAGICYASRHDWDMLPRELHSKLWNSPNYSRLPHYMHKVYGCNKTEYEPEQKSA